ncbi:Putative phosphopantetheine binding ACP domain, ACP-like superfamily [Colletotrichum destructivum]|uniref:Phosphopantetheine binding ACP domain, ACP-like superfamily n=1 Tax=Colletotrichum destructivum TaxID=34406 RepID=A0AAX4J4A2_9PEZI|nr:Putative phosphopantetheine binding ACP domain, ACP-like superfamily [Colletotrichum destructivum]
MLTMHANGGRPGTAGVREQVDSAETEDDAVAIVTAAFGARLETMLQLLVGVVHKNNGLERPIIDLGIDSLVAIEIRTWFPKQLDREVSIVKILGGETVLKISVTAANNLLTNRKELPPGADEPKASNKGVEKAANITVDSNAISADSSGNSSNNSSAVVDKSGSEFESPKETASSSDDGGDEAGNTTQDAKDIVPEPFIIREAPISVAQSRFWFVHKHSDNPAACNNAFYYRLQGRVNSARLQYALRLVAATTSASVHVTTPASKTAIRCRAFRHRPSRQSALLLL